jgi:hypothetical protein
MTEPMTAPQIIVTLLLLACSLFTLYYAMYQFGLLTK